MPKARRVRPQKVANAVKNVVRQETKRKRRRGPSTRGRRPRRFNRRNLKKGERVLTAPYTTTVSWGGTKFMPYVRNGNIGIRASELLTNLTVPAGGYASSNVIYSTVLNPRSFGSGKLRNFAANYDQFKFRNVTVEFVPATGTTTPGRINMSYDRDPLDHRSGISGDALDRVSGSDQLMRSNPVWEKFSLTANDKWINSSRLFYFNDPVNDPRMWSQGTFYIQNMGPLFSGSTEPTQLGTLYVHYDVQFKDFQLSSISTGNSFYSTSTTPTDGSWFAGSTFNQYNNLDLQIVHSTVGADHDEIYFPERGTYYINTWGWWGDPIHTDMQIAFPAVAGGNMVRFIQTNIEDANEKFPIETSAPGVGLWFLKVTVVSPNIPLILTQITGNAPLNNAFFCFLGNEPVPIDILPSGGDPGLRKLVDNLSQRIRQLEITPKPDNCSFNVHTGQILQHNKLEANVVGNVTAEVSNTPAVTISGQPIGVVVEAEKAKRKFKRKQFKMQMEEYFKNAFKQFPNYSDTESVSVISDEDDDEKDV